MHLQFTTCTKGIWKEGSKGKTRCRNSISVKAPHVLCHLSKPKPNVLFPVTSFLTTAPPLPQVTFDYPFLCSMPFHTSYITHFTLYH